MEVGIGEATMGVPPLEIGAKIVNARMHKYTTARGLIDHIVCGKKYQFPEE